MKEEEFQGLWEDALAAWAEYQATGLHVTAEEADASSKRVRIPQLPNATARGERMKANRGIPHAEVVAAIQQRRREWRIVGRAAEVFGSKEKAMDYLKTPLPRFDGRSCLELLKQEGGERMVDELLNQIDEGIYT